MQTFTTHRDSHCKQNETVIHNTFTYLCKCTCNCHAHVCIVLCLQFSNITIITHLPGCQPSAVEPWFLW